MVDDGGGDDRDLATRRGRPAVAASILAVVLIGGYFAASGRSADAAPTGFLANAAVLVIAFWFPSQQIGSLRELAAAWRSLVPWLLAWTLVWDLTTAGLLGERDLFQEWWLVYPSGVVALAALLALHAVIVRRVAARGG